MHASEIEQAQPLIDIGDKDHVRRHPVGKLRMVERRVRMHGAEYARMQVCLQPGLDRIGDHQIGLSLGQRVEDGCVVLPRNYRRFLQMRLIEALVGASWIDDDAHCRLIDLRQGFVPGLLPAMGDRVLPLENTGAENNPALWRSSVMVIPPMAMSNLFASRSDFSVGQLVFTISSLTPSDSARLFAISTSMPSILPEISAIENGR